MKKIRHPSSFRKLSTKNKYYNSLTSTERKVFVSMDAVDTLKGSEELSVRESDGGYGNAVEGSGSLQEIYMDVDNIVICDGCAQTMAAIFAIRCGNQVEEIRRDSYNTSNYSSRGLINTTNELEVFDGLEMRALEELYEIDTGAYLYLDKWVSESNAGKLIGFLCDILKGERLIMIFESIVVNKGAFTFKDLIKKADKYYENR